MKDAKDTVFESETARLYGLAEMAFESWKRSLRGKAKAVELRAAIALFMQLAKFRELDLSDRIEQLEKRFENER